MFHWTQEMRLQITQNLPGSTKILTKSFISLPKYDFFCYFKDYFKIIWLCNISLSKDKSVYPKAVWDALKPSSSALRVGGGNAAMQ